MEQPQFVLGLNLRFFVPRNFLSLKVGPSSNTNFVANYEKYDINGTTQI